MMKRHLLTFCTVLLAAVGARAQSVIGYESFEGTLAEAGYTSTTFDRRNETPTAFPAQYFTRENNPVQTAGGTYTFGIAPGGSTIGNTGGTPPTGNGAWFWASEGARGQNNIPVLRPPQTVTTNNIAITGYNNIMVRVALADARGAGYSNAAPSWETGDHVRINISVDGAAFTPIADFAGTVGPTTASYLTQISPAAGAGTLLTQSFQDFTFNVGSTGSNIRVQVEVDTDGGTEELAFDNLRVLGTAAVTQPPVLANIESGFINYSEGDPSVQITNSLTVADPDNTTLTGATIAISGFVAGQDVLSFTNQNGINGPATTTNGTLTLSGSATLAAYQAALRSVRYQNTETVTATGGLRIVTFTTTDGANTSNAQTRTINVTAQLNAPASLAPSSSYTEDFESNGEGTRYTANSWTSASPCLGFTRTNANPYSCSPVTFGNVSNSYYWYSESTTSAVNPYPTDIGTMVLAPVNATNYGNLVFNIRLATGQSAQWENDDYAKFFYRVNGGSWVLFGAFYGDNAGAGVAGELRRDADLSGAADAGGTVLNSSMQNVALALPPAVTGASVDFMIEISSDGSEELAFDRINITGVLNNTPTIGSQTRSVAENSANGTNVGAPITSSDADGNSLSYSITAGNTNGTFAINSATGQLTVANQTALNFEATPSYSLTVQVTDNGIPAASASATVTVQVTNVNEAPGAITDTNAAANTVAENSATGTTVGITASATDPDAGTTLTYSLTDNAGGRFAINASTGVVTVANGALLDFEANTSHSITVQASDGTLTSSQSFTIAVTDVDDTRPSVVITSTATSPTSTSPIPVTITFSEGVTGFVQGDVTVSGGTISGFSGASGSSIYTFNFIPSGSGTKTVNVPANGGQDAAGNLNTAATQFSIVYALPSTTVASVTRLNPSPTATTQVRYRVVFAASVTGVTVSNFRASSPSGTVTITGTGISSVVGSGTTYDVTVNTGTGSGTLRLDVDNSTNLTPSVSNVPYTLGEVYTITKSFAAQPQLTIVGTGGSGSDVTAFVDVVQVLSGGTAFANALQNGSFETHGTLPNTNSGGKSFGYNPTGASWTFNARSGIAESGSDFTPTTPIPNGIAVALLQSDGAGSNGQIQQNLALPTGSNYQVNFQAAQRICCTTLDQSLNVFLNGVYFGNIQPNENSYSTFTSPTFTVTAPALTASITSTATSPTSTAPIPVTITFSQSVVGFTSTNVIVGNGTFSGFSGSGTTYTGSVMPTGTGLVTVDVPAMSASDANNTFNTAAPQFSIQYNQPVTAAPVVTAPAHVSLINDNTPTYAGTAPAGSTVTVYVDGSSIGTTTATGGNWTLTQPTALTDATHTVNATAQTSGSAVSATSNTNGFTVDATAPTVAITSTGNTNGGSTGTSPIAYTVTFSENVTGFVAGDVTVGNGAISAFAGSGTTYTFNVTPAGNGAVTVDVPANVAQDAASNLNTAASQFSLTYTQPTTATPALLTPADNSVTNQAVTLSGTAPAGSTVRVYVSQNGGAYSLLTLTATSGGTFSSPALPFIPASYRAYATAQSPGQAVSAATAVINFIVDQTAPTVTLTSSTGTSGSTTSATTFAYTATFSESVTGFVATDLTVTNGTVSNFAGSGTTYTFNVTPTTPGTATTVTVPANSAQDAATNGNTASNTYALTQPVTDVVWNGSNNDQNWYAALNWTPAVVPTALISATIPAAAPNMPVIPAGTAATLNLTINSGAALNMTGGTLNVRGNLTNNGTFAPTLGTVTLGTSTLASILGSSRVRFNNLTVNGSAAQVSTSAGASVRRLLTLVGNLTTNGNPFVVESDANLTGSVYNNGGVIVGNVTVQRYILPGNNPGAGYRHISPPVSNATVASLATGSFTPVVNPAYNTSATPGFVTPFPTVFGYDETRLGLVNDQDYFTKGYYSPAALSTPLTVGKALAANLAAQQTFSFTGPQNNGTYSQVLSRGPVRGNPDQSGWHLVGNPYPSPLNYSLVDAADRVNLDAAIYIYGSVDQYSGTFRSYVNGVGMNGDPLLALGQGFWVRVSAGQTSGSLTLRNSHRVTTPYQNPAYYRTNTTRPLVQLDLQGANHADPLYVYFEQGATAGTDAAFDAVKMLNTHGLNLSAVAGNDEMSINGLPVPTTNLTVPLQVRVPATGSYTLHAASIVNLPAGMVAYLRDRQTGAVQDLSQQPDYTFQLNAAYIGQRFELFFTPQRVTATAPASLSAQVAVFPNPAHKAVFVELPATLSRSVVTVTLVDALGRTVLTQSLTAASTQLSLENVAAGVYAVRLQTAQGTVTKKLTVE